MGATVTPSSGWPCSFTWLVVIALACVTGAIGCHKAELSPVAGMLLIDGKPAVGANIVFHPLDEKVVVRPVGVADKRGMFRLMTHATDDGAPPGDYIVTIFWRDESIPIDGCMGEDLIKHDLLQGLYFDSRISKLRATVRSEANRITIEAKGPTEILSKRPHRERVESFSADRDWFKD